MVETLYALSFSLRGRKSQPEPTLRASARVHCPQKAVSFDVVFDVTGEEILAPEVDSVVEGVGCSIEIDFGDAE